MLGRSSITMAMALVIACQSYGYTKSPTPGHSGSTQIAVLTKFPDTQWGSIQQIQYQAYRPGKYLPLYPYLPFKTPKGWGLLNAQSGMIIIKPVHDAIGELVEGKIEAYQKGKGKGFLGFTGAWLIPPKFLDVMPFSEGLAPVSEKGNRWGMIDKNGQWVIPDEFEYLEPLKNGRALAVKQGKIGFINREGAWIIPPQFGNAYAQPSEGLYAVNFIGRWNRDYQEHATPKNSAWGFIDTSGSVVIPPSYLRVVEPFQMGTAVIQDQKGQWQIINKKGKPLLSRPVDLIYPFQKGYAVYAQGKKLGVLDRQGNLITDPIFTDAFSFSEGILAVTQGEGWGFINTQGQWLVPPQYEEVGSFSHGLAPVLKGGKWGYINKHGKLVVPPKYGDAKEFQEGGWAIVGNAKDDGKAAYSQIRYGIINTAGQAILPIQYDWINLFSADRAILKYQEHHVLVDRKGQFIFPKP